ncbi:DUF4249 domain-containing protein [Butyricimonas hominis]|uniref:DUF4249 domain-containing protein n=1 Tax=Butyricimonas hominis TaxID=2763032 RepID=UPI003511F98B
MRRVIFILSFFLFYYGCNNSEEYNFRGEVPDSRLVIYAYAEADSLLYAEISKLRTGTDNTEIDSAWDIKCQVYVNDCYAGELRSSGNNRYLSGIRPKAGDKITIKASCPELEDATGSTTVCNPFPAIELDTFRDMSALQLRVRVKDNGEGVNYYRLVVEDEIYFYGMDWEEGSRKIDSSIKYSYDVDLSGDALLSEGLISTILGKEINTNPYQVFTNETFFGKERVFYASVNYPYSYERKTWMIEHKDTIHYLEKKYHRLRVKVLRIDKSLFDYLYTLGIYEGQPAMYKEPIQVSSNIQGGLGVVGSCYTRETVLDIPVVK